MKKNKKKLPRYWLGAAPINTGYQKQRGLGDTTYTSQRGMSVQPEANAMRQNLLPNAIGNLSQSTQYPMQMLQNMKYIPAGTILTGANAINSAGGISNIIKNGGTLSVGGPLNEGGLPTQIGATTGKASTILNTFGKVTGGVGAALGLYNIGKDIAHEGDTISPDQIANSATTNTVTTPGGNTYTYHSGIDSRGIMDYERQLAKSKKIGLSMDALGLGASVGGLIGGLPGMGIGAAVGLLGGGIASLLGFGDNEDETREMIKNQQDVFAMSDRQSESTAKDRDVKQQFARGYGAANGKAPVWTPSGLFNKKATARVSNGEVVGNFADGIATRIPGKKNNKDTKLAALKDGDFVITNKYGLSDYAAATGDYAGALGLQEMLMGMRNSKGYKNGKLPKFDIGTWQYANAIFPHAFGYLKNQELLNRVESSDRTAPQTQVPDAGASRAIDDMYTDRIDERDYLRQAYDLYRQQLWESRRTPGIGLGGRMLYATNLGTQTQRQLADTRLKINEQNRAQRNAARQMQLQNALNIRAHELDNFWKTAAMRQQINSAYEKYRAQIPLNQYNILSSLGSNLSQIYNTNNALDIQNRMLKLYEQGAETDKRKADAWINSLGNNTTSTANPIKAYDTIKNLYSNLIPTKFGNIRIA